MPEHFSTDGIVPTVLGLEQLADRLGCSFWCDEVERCYRVMRGLASPVQTVEMWGASRAAAAVHIGNWMLRQSEAIHG
jgi:hypothetical protein